MFKNKMKRFITGGISIALCITMLVGCGSEDNEFQGTVDKIIMGKTALLEASNISLSRNLIQETEGEKQKTLNQVVVDNVTKDWYMKSYNMDGVRPMVLGETLLAEGRSYFRGRNEETWTTNLQSNFTNTVGVTDISNIDLEAKDCKNIKITNGDSKEVYEIIMSEYHLKRFKERSIKKVEDMLKEAKSVENPDEATIETTELSLDILKKTSYISSECIFTLDKTGALVGYKLSYVLEQPKVDRGSDGKMFLTDELITFAMSSDIVIETYNDSENIKLLDEIKKEL